MKWLKAELHSHAQEDKEHELPYSVKDLIDQAAKLRYDVLGLTFHNKVFEGPGFSKSFQYAKRKKILLMAGCEAAVEGRHTLIYGITDNERRKIKTFHDLRKLRKEFEKKGRKILVIAPHPYYSTGIMGKYCLGRKLIKNIDVFDAIEYSFFYVKRLNRNKKAVKVAKRYLKPIVGNGDIHVLSNLGRTYSLIRSKKDQSDIIDAIKDHQVKVVSKPLNMRYVVKLAYFHSFKS